MSSNVQEFTSQFSKLGPIFPINFSYAVDFLLRLIVNFLFRVLIANFIAYKLFHFSLAF